MVGQTVGKYRIVSRLGRGGMGTVYRAVDETLNREVAIKSLNADLGDPDLLKRFRAEAVTLARLNHPNIATLYDLTEHDGQLLMVMEFVRGETFDKLSQREGPMPVGRAAQLCVQVLDALEHAHRVGVVHRDLKPANLMLTESGLVKVMDFGLARMMGTEHLTNDGYMVGTPAYMSPEQVLGREIDGRADVYAMGVVLFRLLTAQLPFKADSGIAMVHHQLNDAPTPVRQVRSELSETCESVIARALAKTAGDRFQTAEDFKSALMQLDPALSNTGVARISSIVPSGVTPDVNVAEAEPTLPPTPTPLSSASVGLSPATVVLPRPDGPSAWSATVRQTQSTIVRASAPAIPIQTSDGAAAALASPAPSAVVPAAPPASEIGGSVAPAQRAVAPAAPDPPPGPALPVGESAPTDDMTIVLQPGSPGPPSQAVAASRDPHPSRAAAITSSAQPSSTRRGGSRAVVPVAIVAAVLILAGIPAALFWRSHRAAAQVVAANVAAQVPPAVERGAPDTPAPPADAAAPSSSAAATGPARVAPPTGSMETRPVSPPSTGDGVPHPAPATAAVASAPAGAGAAAASSTSRPPRPSAAARDSASADTADGRSSTTAKNAGAPSAAETNRPALPDVSFARLKLLIVDDTKTRDRDATLRLGNDGFEVVDGTTTLHSGSYAEVIGVYHSHSKEPQWAGADGTSRSVAKAGSAFGFLRGTPDWITLRTTKVFIPLRVREDDLPKLTSELEARTGAKVVTTK